jgi:hypothetical protein
MKFPLNRSFQAVLGPIVLLGLLLVSTFAWAQTGGNLAVQPGKKTERVALVIGNGGYTHVTKLTNTERDATLISETLRQLGFTLVGGGPLLDLDAAGFRKALKEFSERLAGGTVGVFYYAGHGIQLSSVNYLVPVDASVGRSSDVDKELIDARLVVAAMEKTDTKLSIIILDACRNNPFVDRTDLHDVAAGLADMNTSSAKGTLISYATQPGGLASDGIAGQNSPYASALAQAMIRPGLALYDVFNATAVEVSRATFRNQSPWISASPIDTNFYFSGTGADAAGSIKAPNDDAETKLWREIAVSSNAADFQAYLRQYPDGAYAALAHSRLDSINGAARRERVEMARSLGAHIADEVVALDKTEPTVQGRAAAVRALVKTGDKDRARELARELYRKMKSLDAQQHFNTFLVSLAHEALWQSGEIELAGEALEWLRQRTEEGIPADKRQSCIALTHAKLQYLEALGQMNRVDELRREIQTILPTLGKEINPIANGVCDNFLRIGLRAWAQYSEISQVDKILDLFPDTEMRYRISVDLFQIRRINGMVLERSLVEREFRRALDAAKDVSAQVLAEPGDAFSLKQIKASRADIYETAASFYASLDDKATAADMLRRADQSITACEKIAAEAKSKGDDAPLCYRESYASTMADVEGAAAALAWLQKNIEPESVVAEGIVAGIVERAAGKSDRATLQALARTGLSILENANCIERADVHSGDKIASSYEIFLRMVAGDPEAAKRRLAQATEDEMKMSKDLGIAQSPPTKVDADALANAEKLLADVDARSGNLEAALKQAASLPTADQDPRRIELVAVAAGHGDYRDAERVAATIVSAASRAKALGQLVDRMFVNAQR